MVGAVSASCANEFSWRKNMFEYRNVLRSKQWMLSASCKICAENFARCPHFRSSQETFQRYFALKWLHDQCMCANEPCGNDIFDHWSVFVRWFFFFLELRCRYKHNVESKHSKPTICPHYQLLFKDWCIGTFWLLSGLQPIFKDQIFCAVDVHIQQRFWMDDISVQLFQIASLLNCNDNTNSLFTLPIA